MSLVYATLVSGLVCWAMNASVRGFIGAPRLAEVMTHEDVPHVAGNLLPALTPEPGAAAQCLGTGLGPARRAEHGVVHEDELVATAARTLELPVDGLAVQFSTSSRSESRTKALCRCAGFRR